jgi:endonuclease YncB( thermonuclease family)|tara:strand:+ start:1721 stop:2185 length:465 start_codon:yes stop_codon:yes gene_type:complete
MGCTISKALKTDKKPENKKLSVYVPILEDITVIKVYDGDTITVSAKVKGDPLSPKYYKWSVRFRGIDTPEIKAKTKDEKEAAIIARDALSNKILNKKILLEDVNYDKYGRLLANVYLNTLCLNTWMLNNKYGVKYDGGTKHTPVSWIEYQNVTV